MIAFEGLKAERDRRGLLLVKRTLQGRSALILIFLFLSGSGLNSATRVSSTTSSQPIRANVIMPKQLASATVDGRCGDRSYLEAGSITLSDTLGRPGARVSLFHSSRNAYFCLSGLRLPTNQRIAVRINSDHSRSGTVTAADYEFFVTADRNSGTMRGNRTGTFVTFPLPTPDFESAVARPDDQTWSAEMRISLEWFGGYARTDGLSIALEQSNGEMQQQWPRSATRLSPASWGDLVLGPLYSETVNSGSAFLDGRNGYLVIPFAPEFNPREITIEAWARAPEGECGTLVGNGQRSSYWLGLCGELRFTHGGAASVFTGVHPLGDGWHHLAVTMNKDGLRTFYVDGLIDRRPGWAPPEETRRDSREPSAILGVSDRMLRIGSDRDAPEDEKSLRGYVRELRIWNRARSASEIRADAFRSLTGRESGLVALWPFTGGLQELVGGRNAGLIGDASLAREAPSATAFAPLPAPTPSAAPRLPRKTAAWDAVIPLTEKRIRLDGVCSTAEYAAAAKVRLEPHRVLSLNLMETSEALILCTGPLFSKGDPREGITLWINRDGRPGSAPSPADLSLHITRDGKVTIAAGDGGGFNGAAPAGIESKTISGAQFSPQEDIRTVDAPWFSTEVRIPFQALVPLNAGDRLRFAIEYRGTAPGSVGSQPRRVVELHEQWPATFNAVVPQTWGVAVTRRDLSALPDRGIEIASTDLSGLKLLMTGLPSEPSAGTELFKTTGRSNSLPAFEPTSQTFKQACPESLMDNLSYATDAEFKWPLVDLDQPIVQVEGRMSTHHNISAPVSDVDSKPIHNTNDVDMAIDVSPDSKGFIVDQTVTGSTSLVIETESGGFPAALEDRTTGKLDGKMVDVVYSLPVRPGKDDHVTVVGNWIYDCGHAAKAEIHPVYMFESDRLEFVPVLQGKPMQPVRVVHVWMNSDPSYQRHATLGTFNFTVDLPPAAGSKYFVRVKQGIAGVVPPKDDETLVRASWAFVEQGKTNLVSAELSGKQLNFSVQAPSPTGQYYFEIIIGPLDNPKNPGPSLYEVLTHLGFLTIKNDHDAAADAEWYMAAAVNGRWQQMLWDASVTEGKLDGGHHPHQFFTTKPELVWEVTAFDQDASPGSDEGVFSDTFPPISLANLANDPLAKNELASPDWSIKYMVADITDLVLNKPAEELPPEVRPVLADTQFWQSRLNEEPNDVPGGATKLGLFDVPASGQQQTSHAASITESPLDQGGVRLIGRDDDWYSIDFSDFAEVSVGSLPPRTWLRGGPHAAKLPGNAKGFDRSTGPTWKGSPDRRAHQSL